MDVIQSNEEDFITNAFNNLDENDILPNDEESKGNNDGDGDAVQQHDNAFNEEHIHQMKLKKQAKREKKQLKSKQREELIANGHYQSAKNTFLGKHKWLGGAVDPKTGKIYGIPAHSYQIICITPPPSKESHCKTSDEKKNTKLGEISTIPLPNEFQEGKYKWLRGLVYDGYLFGIPAWSVKGILKVKLHPDSNSTTRDVKVLPLPHDSNYYKPKLSYCESRKQNMNNNESSNNKNGKGRNRNFSDVDRSRWLWHGGAVGKFSDDPNSDAAIYCIPSNAQHVLKVYLDGSDNVEEIGPTLSEGQNKW